MELLGQKVKEDGVVIDEKILKVDGFLNHQIDAKLMNEVGRTFSILEVEVFSSLVFGAFSSLGVRSCPVLAACVVTVFAPAVMFIIANRSALSVDTLSTLVDCT
ncbi:hypothetical protein, partial [Atlantibacter hermannii]|uniref:hypothetical protein n=1 Tax=Atlantibacter hermannii TaxID=565 RepID=UPI0034D9F79E